MTPSRAKLSLQTEISGTMVEARVLRSRRIAACGGEIPCRIFKRVKQIIAGAPPFHL